MDRGNPMFVAFGRLDLLIQFRMMKVVDVTYGTIEDCGSRIRVNGAYTQQMDLSFPEHLYDWVSSMKPNGVFIYKR